MSLFFNKSFVTNFIAGLVFILGISLPELLFAPFFKTIGLFALSGAITNWLAVHMLFEKIPFLYGSGVIPNQFEAFKNGIKHLIMNEFFHKAHIERFFRQTGDDKNALGLVQTIQKKIDFNQIFEGLVDAIKASSFGGMLQMFGGEKALAPLREPMIEKLKRLIVDMANNPETEALLKTETITDTIQEKIENMVELRLNELTPHMVKDIIQKMIKAHLGWLVVWGGVFGAMIGFVAELV